MSFQPIINKQHIQKYQTETIEEQPKAREKKVLTVGVPPDPSYWTYAERPLCGLAQGRPVCEAGVRGRGLPHVHLALATCSVLGGSTAALLWGKGGVSETTTELKFKYQSGKAAILDERAWSPFLQLCSTLIVDLSTLANLNRW